MVDTEMLKNAPRDVGDFARPGRDRYLSALRARKQTIFTPARWGCWRSSSGISCRLSLDYHLTTDEGRSINRLRPAAILLHLPLLHQLTRLQNFGRSMGSTAYVIAPPM
jgi:hypothetical protein